MRFITPAPLACVFLGLLAALQASARVGETQDEFEHRILQPFVGKFMPKDKNADPVKEEELVRQQPFNDIREHFPEGVRERKYWKSAVPNMLSNENGWRVHVFFQDNRSVLEAYQRVGDSLSQFEIENLLRANQGTSEWRKIDPESDEAKASSIGCDYALADGTKRARVIGSWIMVFSTKLDAYVKDQFRLLSENRANQQAERLRQQQLNAPSSTSGF
jgi:hypothetical protein